jgi:hypothetical protein
LSPSIVLEVLKILEREIGLREETRSLDQARAALASNDYAERAQPLAETQADLADRVFGVVQKICELPGGETGFAREIALLARVEQVMHEAHGLLTRPETGPETIAAETEVIELLLQTRRINPKSGGGGGSTPGGGGGGDTDEPALALIGAGSEREAQSQARTVEQATGVRGSELPAEFRSGLDAYFSALERSRGSGSD